MRKDAHIYNAFRDKLAKQRRDLEVKRQCYANALLDNFDDERDTDEDDGGALEQDWSLRASTSYIVRNALEWFRHRHEEREEICSGPRITAWFKKYYAPGEKQRKLALLIGI